MLTLCSIPILRVGVKNVLAKNFPVNIASQLARCRSIHPKTLILAKTCSKFRNNVFATHCTVVDGGLLPAESQLSLPGWLCDEPPARWLPVGWQLASYMQQSGYVYKWCHGLGDHSRYRSIYTCASKCCTVSTPVHNPVYIAPDLV